MLKIRFHRNFEKQFKKLPASVKQRFFKRLEIFEQFPYHPTLNTHILRGTFDGYQSINVTGDVRAIFMMNDRNIAFFVAIGTHGQLYS